MTVEIQNIYRLGEFELDPNKRLLKREDGETLHAWWLAHPQPRGSSFLG